MQMPCGLNTQVSEQHSVQSFWQCGRLVMLAALGHPRCKSSRQCPCCAVHQTSARCQRGWFTGKSRNRASIVSVERVHRNIPNCFHNSSSGASRSLNVLITNASPERKLAKPPTAIAPTVPKSGSRGCPWPFRATDLPRSTMPSSFCLPSAEYQIAEQGVPDYRVGIPRQSRRSPPCRRRSQLRSSPAVLQPEPGSLYELFRCPARTTRYPARQTVPSHKPSAFHREICSLAYLPRYWPSTVTRSHQ